MPPTLPNMCPVLEFAQYEDEDLTLKPVEYFFEISGLSEDMAAGSEMQTIEEDERQNHGDSHVGGERISEGFVYGSDTDSRSGQGEDRPVAHTLHDYHSDHISFRDILTSLAPRPYRERSIGGPDEERGDFDVCREETAAPFDQLKSPPPAYANSVLARAAAPQENILRILHSLMARVSQVEASLLGLTPILQEQIRQSLVDSPKPPKIHKPVLDRACTELFERAPEPTPHQLTALVATLLDEHPGIEYRPLLSVIRKWFRKRREDVGNRLLTATKRKNPDFKTRRARLAQEYQTGLADICQLIEEARLPLPRDLQGREAFIAFCRKKVIGHLERQPQSG